MKEKGAAMKYHVPPALDESAFDDYEAEAESDREIVLAWVVVILLLVVNSVAFWADHAATLTP
jgi:hypothetical protein